MQVRKQEIARIRSEQMSLKKVCSFRVEKGDGGVEVGVESLGGVFRGHVG